MFICVWYYLHQLEDHSNILQMWRLVYIQSQTSEKLKHSHEYIINSLEYYWQNPLKRSTSYVAVANIYENNPDDVIKEMVNYWITL